MGCRHCFVVDLVEEIVGEGGSRSSSRVHEHDSYQLVSQQNVAIQVSWSRCPPRQTTVLTVLSWFVSSSKLKFVLSREKRVWGAPSWGQTTGLTVLSWSGFGSWLAWLWTFCLSSNFSFWLSSNFWTQILSSSHVSRKSLEEAEVTHKLSRVWLLLFPSEQLSGCNKLGVFREEWWRLIVSDRTSIFSSRKARLMSIFSAPYFDVSSMLHACIVRDNGASQVDRVRILVFFVHSDPQAWLEHCLSACRAIFASLVWILQLMMECKLIAHLTR